jgi:putative flippase GtrA
LVVVNRSLLTKSVLKFIEVGGVGYAVEMEVRDAFKELEKEADEA